MVSPVCLSFPPSGWLESRVGVLLLTICPWSCSVLLFPILVRGLSVPALLLIFWCIVFVDSSVGFICVLRAEALDTLPNVVVDDKEDEELIELALVPGVVVTLLFLVGWGTVPFRS